MLGFQVIGIHPPWEQSQRMNFSCRRPRATRHHVPSHNSFCRLLVFTLAVLALGASGTARAQTPPLDAFPVRPNGFVRTFALQPDGAIILGGGFSQISGQAVKALARLDPGGTLDTNFLAQQTLAVGALAVPPDGRIVVGWQLNHTPADFLARYHPNGALDTTFHPAVTGFMLDSDSGRQGVYALIVQPDRRLLVAGSFTTAGGQSRPGLARLEPDGSLDATFAPAPDGAVLALALLPDGRIVLGGQFTTVGGQPRQNLARVHPDGSLDEAFNPGANFPVRALAQTADGSLIVGGSFSTLGGRSVERLGRLDPTGAADPSFNPRVSSQVETIAVQSDGKILVGGLFSTVSGQSRKRLARLHADGALDSAFNPTADDTFGGTESVTAVGLQPDGRVLVAGTFLHFGGQDQPWVARLAATEPATDSLAPSGADLLWSRSGTGPEVVRTAFRVATHGTDWSAAVPGTRVPGGWIASGLTLPPNGTALAEAPLVMGAQGSSSGWIRSALGAPAILRQPSGAQLSQGSNLLLEVEAVGSGPLTYQWMKDGLALADGGGVRGTQTALLSLANVSGLHSGVYTVSIAGAQGSILSTPAPVTVGDPYLIAQPAGLTIDEARPVTLSVTAGGTQPLSYQWFRQGQPLAGRTNATLAFQAVRGPDSGDYQAVVANSQGSVTSLVATLNVLRVVDAFDPQINPDPDWLGLGHVNTLARQPDGMILLGGAFSTLRGVPCPPLVRVFPDGAPDPAFQAELESTLDTAGPAVSALVVQPDGQILVGRLNTTNACLLRLHPDGRRDPAFSVSLGGRLDDPSFPAQGVYALDLQPDGRVLVAGNFTEVAGQPHRHLALLGPDGSPVPTFVPNPDGPVSTLARSASGQILLGGSFTNVASQPRRNLARLAPDGALDASFQPNPNFPVFSLAFQADGALIVGGAFDTIAGQPRARLARLNPDDSLDPSWQPNVSAEVQSAIVQTDGRLLIAGRFEHVNFGGQFWISRLHPNGATDTNFVPTYHETRWIEWPHFIFKIAALAQQPDGQVLVGGHFHSLAGLPRGDLGRLVADADTNPPVESLQVGGGAVTWLRSGSQPELQRVVFDYSTNGTTWSEGVAGLRSAGGWQAANLGAPAGAAVRARGYLNGGGHNGSAWLVESRTGPPALLRQPTSGTATLGATVSFYAAAVGSPTLAYQWFKDGQPLTDQPPFSGARTATLTLNGVSGPDAGAYSVVVSNDLGQTTSSAAQLAVGDPIIVAHPANLEVFEGSPASLSVTASGTPPIAYQWRMGGAEIPHGTNATLHFASAQASDDGLYQAVATSPYGQAASSTVRLKVLTRSLPDTFNPGANGFVGAFAPQPDGQILVGGGFTVLGGQARHFLARLQPDGALDAGFNPGADDAVLALLLQPDGRVVVGGQFTTLAGQPRRFLGRLLPDGSLDPGFRPEPDWIVTALALQADGHIVVGGQFASVDGVRRSSLARLRPDGSLDPEFAPQFNGYVLALAPQPDGRIVVGGEFTAVNDLPRPFIARLSQDGSPDSTFTGSLVGAVSALVLRSDGTLVAGGNFRWATDIWAFLARLQPDGTPDYTEYPASAPDGTVQALALQADGKLLAGGDFSVAGSTPRHNLARFLPDGSLDASFNPGARGPIYTLTLQPDGRLLVGGAFDNLGGASRASLGRLRNTERALEALVLEDGAITWLRDATTPEAWRTTFEMSPDGLAWSELGPGKRVDGGWQSPEISGTGTPWIRARGWIQQTTGWFVQSITVPPGSETPPRLHADANSVRPDGSFQFEITSTPGAVLEIQASPDLGSTVWTTLDVVTSATGRWTFIDPAPSATPRFYRVRQIAR